jgi:hypothetical protein
MAFVVQFNRCIIPQLDGTQNPFAELPRSTIPHFEELPVIAHALWVTGSIL